MKFIQFIITEIILSALTIRPTLTKIITLLSTVVLLILFDLFNQLLSLIRYSFGLSLNMAPQRRIID